MSETRLPVAVLGASGYIGQQFVRLLHDHPRFEIEVLGAGTRSAARRLGDVWHLAEPPPSSQEGRALVRASPSAMSRRGIRAVFSALPSGAAGPLETELIRRGIAVFSNASDHRMDPRVPLLVPEVNPGHLEIARRRPPGRGLLVTNPNCSAAGLTLALAPVRQALAPSQVHVATYQALSGAGVPGVPSLSVTDNVVPYIAEEEEKIARESQRILGRRAGAIVRPLGTRFLAHCVRVGTREGHLEAVTVVAGRRPTLAELRALWAAWDPLSGRDLPTAPHPPVVLRHQVDRPQPLRDRWAGSPDRARGMAAVVGRIRWDPPFLRFFVLSHNAVRGGAGGSVLNAELSLDAGIPWVAGRPNP